MSRWQILCRHRWCFRPVDGYAEWCEKHIRLIAKGWHPAEWDPKRLVEPKRRAR